MANMMASSIIGCRIDYCNSLLIGISEQNLDRLRRVQSKAARIVCIAGRQVTSSGVLYSHHCLPVRRRIEFKTATLCFKAVRLVNPLYLKNTLSRMNHYNLCVLPLFLALTLHLASVAFLWLDHESGMDYHMSYDSATHFRVSSLT